MKSYLIILLMSGLLGWSACSRSDSDISVIPKPASIENGTGSFVLEDGLEISTSGAGLEFESSYLQSHMEVQTGIQLALSNKSGDILLKLVDSFDENPEAYQLSVDQNRIQIQAGTRTGVFYGIQSLLQLAGVNKDIPVVKITDSPRFVWRGFMLDVSRHFFPKEYILKVLDYLAMHKLNTFHWHLTDDQGWRLEIKKYPKLTEISAWRVDRENEHWNSWTPAKPSEEATYGGFYTQDDIREIVAYARERHITIVPEIEMPGHTTAVLAAYPELSCTGGPFQVPSGGLWPITDIFCAGKEETFVFLENVLSEVMQLFPSEYIHIGGDEANKKEWETCPECQKRISNLGLEDEHELQSYFITRIEKFLNANGRQLIGWDEILEGGLAPNAAVMSWRGMQGGVQAAKSQHPVVMSPTSHCYFDYYQGKPELEPLAIGGYLPLEKVYSFNPVPEELTAEEAAYILGAQANLWTEYVYKPEDADYMTFPRLAALSEVVWSSAENREFNDFARRLNNHLNLLEVYDINYSKSFANVTVQSSFDLENKEFLIELKNSINFAEIRYTIDGTDPTSESPVYNEPFTLDETSLIKAATFVDGNVYSAISSERVWIHKGTGSPLTYQTEYSAQYPGDGRIGLTNSLRGSLNHGDGRWQGYSGNDLSVIIDLQETKKVNRVSVGCLQNIGSWIFFPSDITIELMDEDKLNLASITILNDQSIKNPQRSQIDYSADFNQRARYIQVTARNQGTCPEWHAGAGSPAWLFIDEIIVE